MIKVNLLEAQKINQTLTDKKIFKNFQKIILITSFLDKRGVGQELRVEGQAAEFTTVQNITDGSVWCNHPVRNRHRAQFPL